MTLSGLGEGGQNALWLVFIIQGIAALVYGFSAFKLPVNRREHYVVTTMIVATAALSYFAMATGLGHLSVDLPEAADKAKEHTTRLIFYARYIDWTITTPLLLLDVLLIAKLPLAAAGWAIFADVAMVITGLIGAVDGSQYRWGWFVIGCLFMVAIFITLFVDGAKAVERRDSGILSFYNSIVLSLVVLWTCYPIVWALGEGVGYLSSDTEAYLYAILDVLAKVGWGGFIVYSNDKLYESYGKGVSDAEAPLVQA